MSVTQQLQSDVTKVRLARRAGTWDSERAKGKRAALWRRWALANMLGELGGFGLAGLVLFVGGGWLGLMDDGAPVLGQVAVVGVAALLEGSILGFAQWRVLRSGLPGLRLRDWLGATVIGGAVAWGVGMAIGTSVGGGLEVEPSPLLMVAGAAVIGLVAGAALSLVQWLVLRCVARDSAWWVPVHSAAWALGMAVCLAGTNFIQADMPPLAVGLLSGGIGLAMGLAVAGITGGAVVRLRPR